MNKNVNYGNWVPEKMLGLCYAAAAVFGIAAWVTGPVLYLAIPAWESCTVGNNHSTR